MRNSFFLISSFVTLGTLLVLGGCDSGTVRPADDTGPWIEFDQKSHDFGPMYSSEKREKIFKVQNRGKSDLKINDTKVECGCLTPIFSTLVIAPGKSADMRVLFHPPMEGPIAKKIWIYTNDAWQRESVIEITSIGLGNAVLEPAIIDIGKRLPMAGLERTAVLRLPPDELILDVKLVCRSPWIKVEVEKPLGGSLARLTLRVEGLHEIMRFRERIEVIVSAEVGGKKKDFALPFGWQVIGEITPDVLVTPPALFLGAMAKGTDRSREFAISGGSIAHTRLEGLASSTLIDLGTGRYSVSTKADHQAQRLFGRVVLTLAAGGEVIVPVHGAVTP